MDKFFHVYTMKVWGNRCMAPLMFILAPRGKEPPNTVNRTLGKV